MAEFPNGAAIFWAESQECPGPLLEAEGPLVGTTCLNTLARTLWRCGSDHIELAQTSRTNKGCRQGELHHISVIRSTLFLEHPPFPQE